MNEFENKIAIITGAAGGLGAEISMVLASKEIQVVLADKSEKVHEVFENLKSAYPNNKGFSLVIDVTSEKDMSLIIEKVVNKFDRIDIMVNNAGVVQKTMEIADMPLGELNKVWDVNFKGVFLGSKYAARQMKKQNSGSIINVSSFYGKRGYKYYAAYCSSKAAVITLTQSLAMELAEYNINANSICPGFMATEMHWEALRNEAEINGVTFEETKNEVAASIPLKRHGVGEDIAGAILYLSSKAASYVTGHAMNVNGGVEVN